MMYFSILPLLFNRVRQHTMLNKAWQHGIQKHKCCKVSSCSSSCLCMILNTQDNFNNMALQKTVNIIKHFLLLMVSPWHSQSFRSSSVFITSDFWGFYKLCLVKGWRMCHLSKMSIQHGEGILCAVPHKDKWSCLWLEYDGHLQL